MYLAVAYFQQGVSNFLLNDFEEALANFNDTLLYLRGNTMIDYAQLGLLFKLYSCEVLFNRGLCYIYLQQKEAGMQDLSFAVKEKVVEDHNVIDEAIREEAEVGDLHLLTPCGSDNFVGLYGVFDTSWGSVSTERSQGPQFEDEGLPWQGPSSSRLGPV
jgi:tetratricopeptide (TPR) repeat protein